MVAVGASVPCSLGMAIIGTAATPLITALQNRGLDRENQEGEVTGDGPQGRSRV